MNTAEQEIRVDVMLLAYVYGAALVLIGLDKVLGTYLVVDWTRYVSPLAQSVLPIAPTTLVTILGVAEVLVGIALFTQWKRYAAYVVMAVLAVIIVDLFDLGHYDIAARDFLIGVGAYVLTRLDTVLRPRLA